MHMTRSQITRHGALGAVHAILAQRAARPIQLGPSVQSRYQPRPYSGAIAWWTRLAGALLGVALATSGAAAQPAATNWPTRPIRVIIPQPPGGVIDNLVRPMAETLRQRLGQPIILDNRPGGNNVVGLEACALAAPDGETFCAVSIEVMSIYPHVEPALYARWASLRPITLIARGAGLMFAHPDVPADDLAGFVRWARGRTDLNYGSFGEGSSANLLYEWLKSREKLDLLHVPYRGAVESFNETAAGRVQVSYIALGFALPHVQANRIKPLAVLGTERSPHLPNTPSLGELGYDYPYAGGWWGLAAPARTPDAIAERMAAAVRAAVRDPEFRGRYLDPQAYEGVGNTPDEFAALIVAERARGLELVRAAAGGQR